MNLDELELLHRAVEGGYCSAPELGDALQRAFPALLALARDGEWYREMEQKMRAFADAEYVLGIDIATYSAACQGSEAKLASGTFGAKELKAHEKMNRHFGAHFGIHAAIDAARKGEKP